MEAPIIITIPKITSKTLTLSPPIAKTNPLTNKNKPKIKTNPPKDPTLKTPNIQNDNPTTISNIPKNLTIMKILNKKGFLNYSP